MRYEVPAGYRAFTFFEEPGVKRRRTAVFVVAKDGEGALAIAYCSPRDQFSRKIGRDIATGRAVRRLVLVAELRLDSHGDVVESPKGYSVGSCYKLGDMRTLLTVHHGWRWRCPKTAN